MASEVESMGDQGRRHLSGLLLASIVLILMGFVNLPFQYVEVESYWRSAMESETDSSHDVTAILPRMAGWPFNYWVQYTYMGISQDRYWSLPRLMLNLVVAVCAATIVYVYIELRSRHTSGTRDLKFIFDLGVAAAILLIPGLVLASQHRIAVEHCRLSDELVRTGSFRLSCWLPEVAVNHIPRGLMPSFARIREVQVVNADSSVMQTIAEVPTLVELQSFQGSFAASALEPLRSSVHFSGLALWRHKLTSNDLDLIANLHYLSVLRLLDTNLDAEMLRRLDKLPLRSVDLSRSLLDLSELGTPQWSMTVEKLSLTRPKQGDFGSIEIDGWPRLKQLSLGRRTSRMNPAKFKVRLSNLPNLERLALDRLQKHDCVLRNLPRLSFIDEGLGDVRQVQRFEDLIPGLMWLSNLEVDGVMSLNEIQCFARDLETLSIQNAPNLRILTIGSFNVSDLGDITLQPADAKRCQTWLDQLGNSSGPGTVDLTALPLQSCDLSPLVSNPRIRHLRLAQSGVSFQQIQDLEGMDQLESLDIRNCKLEQDQLTWLLQEFPNLERLSIDGGGLKKFEISTVNRLKTLNTTVLREVTDVRLVDLPSVEMYLRFASTPQQLEIRNVPSLRGLVIETPWPENAILEGLRDLDWFAGGGNQIDDELMGVVLRCRGIDQLTLAYTSITREKFIGIGQLDRLSLLSLPGANVDDEITATWHRLKSLWQINLDDTAISVRTIAWLSGIDSLRRVSLNRVPFTDAAADALAELVGVSDLHLADVSIDPEKLKPLFATGNLETLNLSGWNVDETLIESLGNAQSLVHLILHNTNVDPPTLERILDENQNLYVDVGENRGLISEKMAAELRHRAMAIRKRFKGGWRESLAGGDPIYEIARDLTTRPNQRRDRFQFSSSTFEKGGRIDPTAFRSPRPGADASRDDF